MGLPGDRAVIVAADVQLANYRDDPSRLDGALDPGIDQRALPDVLAAFVVRNWWPAVSPDVRGRSLESLHRRTLIPRTQFVFVLVGVTDNVTPRHIRRVAAALGLTVKRATELHQRALAARTAAS